MTIEKLITSKDFTVLIDGEPIIIGFAPLIAGSKTRAISVSKDSRVEMIIEGSPQSIAVASADALSENDCSMYDFLVPKEFEVAVALRALEEGIVTEKMLQEWFYSDFSPEGIAPFIPELTAKEPPTPPVTAFNGHDLTDPAILAKSRKLVASVIKGSDSKSAVKLRENVIDAYGSDEAENVITALMDAIDAWQNYHDALDKFNAPKKTCDEPKPRVKPTMDRVCHFIFQYLVYRGLSSFIGDMTEFGLHLLSRGRSNTAAKEAIYAEQHEKYQHLVEN